MDPYSRHFSDSPDNPGMISDGMRGKMPTSCYLMGETNTVGKTES